MEALYIWRVGGTVNPEGWRHCKSRGLEALNPEGCRHCKSGGLEALNPEGWRHLIRRVGGTVNGRYACSELLAVLFTQYYVICRLVTMHVRVHVCVVGAAMFMFMRIHRYSCVFDLPIGGNAYFSVELLKCCFCLSFTGTDTRHCLLKSKVVLHCQVQYYVYVVATVLCVA